MSTKTELYDEKVRCRRQVSALAGPGEEWTTLTEMRADGGILAAFADDDDIQEITVCSSNLGFVRVYRKFYKGRADGTLRPPM